MSNPEVEGTTDLSESVDKDQQREEKISKLFKISKITILISLTILWIVTAVLGLISLWKGQGILGTPWVIFGLVLTVVIIVVVVIPLFRNLRSDVKEFNKQKAEKEKIEEELGK
jgi:membrane protein YdbS with pleckstrin-like domain